MNADTEVKNPIKFEDPCVDDLGDSLDGGAIIELGGERGEPSDLVLLEKALVSRIGKFAVHIYADEHPPPHFHVLYHGEQNSFNILTGEPLYPDNGLKKYFKNIKSWYGPNRPKLISFWNKFRPTDCCVGIIDENF